MSNIINRSGAETDLFGRLSQRGIRRFSTIDDLFRFKKNYLGEIEDYRKKTATEIEVESENLSKEIALLKNEYKLRRSEQTALVNSEIAQLTAKLSHPTKGLVSKIRRHFLMKRLTYLESHFSQMANDQIQILLQNRIKNVMTQLTRLSSDRQNEIERRSTSFIAETKRIVVVLSELAPVIYGAIGELRAIELLRKLPDDYYVINDYRHSFHRPLYMKSEDDWIYSIQLDHVVIGPTGVFVIETKFWSSKSIADKNLYSPIKQLRRGGHALFVILNKKIRDFEAFNSHWGSVQVSVANILLMMNASTGEQFQFVKILTESNLLGHIAHRPVVLTKEQVRCLVNEVL